MVRFALVGLRVVSIATVTVIALDAQAETKSAGPRAQDFASPTVMVIGANFELGASQATGDLLNVSWGGSIDPSIDVFIFRSVSLGTTFDFSYARSKDQGSATSYGVTPRIGYAFPIGKNAGFWPRLGLGIVRGITQVDDAPSLHQRVILLNLFSPMYFLPVKNVLLGIGPLVTTQLLNRVEGESHGLQTTIGFQTEIAGWL